MPYQVMRRRDGNSWWPYGHALATLEGARQFVDLCIRFDADCELWSVPEYTINRDGRALTPVIKSLYQVREGWPTTIPASVRSE